LRNGGENESEKRGSSGEEIDDLLDGFVGAVVGGFKLARRLRDCY
jgi:hypothetical protein